MMEGTEGLLKESADNVLTVSDVTGRIKALLETGFPLVWVEGEISNFVHHSSGHMYFTLKDASSSLPAVMFRGRNARLSFRPENGAKVRAHGRISIYEPQGKYQIIVDRMREAGVGDLAAAFERLKRRLADEGLFDPAHKRPIPAFPGTVAVVTSPTGAAVRDVVRVVRSRAPWIRLVVAPTRVQGAGAAEEIAEAIRLVDEWGEADVMIVGRGGGSLEDLWAFNEEVVARAVHGAKTPVVSAVGHEVDFSITDFAADVRAATPSNAGELVAPDRTELLRNVASAETRLVRAVSRWYEDRYGRLRAALAAYAFKRPLERVEAAEQRVDELVWRAGATARAALDRVDAELARLRAALEAGDPAGLLERGYALVARDEDGRPVRSIGEVSPGAGIRVTIVDGSLGCTVDSVDPQTREDRWPERNPSKRS
ncbi:MAG: exodeoxyribonuclease VII large subunit [Candidatus Eisenbacteria bacterium]|nr:exodeoxyribonuclease VII large subunit [Candidatus Eisenbacteria bacterium]